MANQENKPHWITSINLIIFVDFGIIVMNATKINNGGGEIINILNLFLLPENFSVSWLEDVKGRARVGPFSIKQTIGIIANRCLHFVDKHLLEL